MTAPASTSSQAPAIDFTDVNRHNFSAALPIIRSAIQEATFIAIDTEFTGLMPDGVYEDALDTYDERYKRWLAASENFIICQFGLAAFKWHSAPAAAGGGYWEASTFNAYVFPRPDDGLGWDKRFTCQASSLSYLAAQGFDFNKFIRDGIGYMPLRLRDTRMKGLAAEADKQALTMQLRTPEEEKFVEELRTRMQAWITGAEPRLQLPLPPSKRLITLLKMVIQEEFQLPSLGYDPFRLEMRLPPRGGAAGASGRGRGGDGDGDGDGGSASSDEAEEGPEDDLEGDVEAGDGEVEEEGPAGGERPAVAVAAEGYVLLRRLDGWQQEPIISKNMQLTVRQRAELMAEKIGFSQVFEAICEARRPVVAHNGCFDLAFTLAQFSGNLPRTLPEYKALLQQTFPGGLYDTKYLAQHLAQNQDLPLGDTSLGSLHRTLTDEQWFRANVRGLALAGGPGGVPEVRHAPGHTGYEGVTDKAHEAGFDAFMTGSAFARLLRIAEGKAAAAAAVLGLSSGPASSSGSGADGNSSSGGVDSATSTAGVLPPEVEALLQPVLPYRGRLHIMRSDLQYMDVYGKDPTPNRPCMIHVAGFTPTTRPSFLIGRFQEAGLGPVTVSMQYSPGGAAVGALVQLPRVDLVPRALQLARRKWPIWTVQTYKSYHEGLQQQGQGQDAASGTGGAAATVRAPPRYISMGPGAAEAARSSPAQPEGQRDSSAAARTPLQVAREAASGRDAAEERWPRHGANVAGNERQRLQAVTREVAAVATSSGRPGARSGANAGTAAAESAQRRDDERGNRAMGTRDRRPNEVPAPAREADEGAAGASTSSQAPSSSAADEGAGQGQRQGTGAGNANSVRSDEAAWTIAERLRLAAERLKAAERKNAVARSESSGSGGGVTLQRPSRPGAR